jgi:hypothetical protein
MTQKVRTLRTWEVLLPDNHRDYVTAHTFSLRKGAVAMFYEVEGAGDTKVATPVAAFPTTIRVRRMRQR